MFLGVFMKKYNIENFYIGELYIGIPFSYTYYLYAEKERIETLMDIKLLKINDAIFCNDNSRYIDHDKKIEYIRFLALFYKTNQGYLCLQNNKIYDTAGNDFCKNLYPFKKFLPKVDFKGSNTFSMNQALDLFCYLYHDKNNRLYKKVDYKVEDFYTGELNICTSFTDKLNKKKFECLNLAQIKMLQYIDNKKIVEIFDTININDDINKYNYLNFNTIFLKTDNRLLNLHDNHIYKEDALKQSISPGENFYENLTNLKEFIDVNDINYSKDTITVKKALKLLKKRIK